VIMFGHLLSDAPDHDAFSIVVDFDQALVTLLHGTMGTPYIANEAAVKTVFGVVEMQGSRRRSIGATRSPTSSSDVRCHGTTRRV
jgi:hypothetical protein